MVCDVLVCETWKAGGLFGNLTDSIQCTEFTNWDAYSLNIFDTNYELPEACVAADPNLPYCQILGPYRMFLQYYNTRPMLPCTCGCSRHDVTSPYHPQSWPTTARADLPQPSPSPTAARPMLRPCVLAFTLFNQPNENPSFRQHAILQHVVEATPSEPLRAQGAGAGACRGAQQPGPRSWRRAACGAEAEDD